MLSLLYIQTALSAAFLEDALPLKLVSITPREATRLSGRDALTVVFSRPVIALGSDFSGLNSSIQGGLDLDPSMIPFHLVDTITGKNLLIKGKTRWVTTFIVRFDVDEDWASDLSFKVMVNPSLRTFDGVPIKLPAPEASFTTAPLTICASNVRSAKASKVTNNQWLPSVNGSTNPEVPDDGELELQFSYPVMRSLLAQFLKLRARADHSQVEFTLNNCTQDPEHTPGLASAQVASLSDSADCSVTCVAVKPKNLVRNGRYEVYIPKGTKYHPFAGPLSKDVTAPFTGLLPFNFLVENTRWSSHIQYDFALRHGLAEGTTLDMIKQQLSLTQDSNKIPFDLSLHNVANLRITAAFQPKTQYTLTVRGSGDGATAVKDGFDQVMESQVIQWNTTAAPTFLVSPPGYVVFEKAQFNDTKWSVLVRGDPIHKPPGSFALAPVPLNKVAEALSYLDYSSTLHPDVTSTVDQGTDPTFRVATLSLPSTPLFMRFSSSWSNSYLGAMTSITDLAVATLSDYDGLLVWVTRMSSGENVQGAQVKLFEFTSSYPAKSPNILITSGTTDEAGLVRLNISSAAYRYNMRVLVSFNDDATMVLNVAQNSLSIQDVTTEVVTDRAVYKPGDDVHIKLYARSQAPDFVWALPKSGTYTLSAVWRSESGGSKTTSRSEVPITWSESWGTWSTSLTIPTDATYGDKILYVQYRDLDDVTNEVGSSFITIADPRRPTAAMTLTSDTGFYRIYPDLRTSSLPIKATVLTGTGDPISGASIDVAWQLDSSDNTTSGVVVLKTEKNGEATLDLDLVQELRNSQQWPVVPAGSSLTLTATWVGPTGELLTSELSVRVGYTEWGLAVTPTISTPIPGLSFGVYVTVTGRQGVEVKERAVTITLQEINDGLSPVGEPISTCKAISGDSNVQCLDSPFLMPRLLKYRLLATVTDDQGYTLTHQTVLGKTAAEWRVSPLSQFTSIDFRLDQAVYKLGDTAKLKFWNPFPRATLMVRYGNRGGKSQFQTSDVIQGSNSIDIPVDAATRTKGCSLAAILSIPRTHQGDSSTTFALPVDLPVSLLFDPLAPRTFTTTGVHINVVKAKHDLVVNLKLDSVRVEPGTSVDLTIDVFAPDQQTRVESEVAIFVVDQAFLDIQPHPLASLPSTFNIDRSDYFQSEASTDNLVTYKGYAETIAAFQRRIARDPWIYPNWQTSVQWGQAAIDMTDDDFVAQFYSRLSTFGSGGYCSTYRNHHRYRGNAFTHELLLLDDMEGDGEVGMKAKHGVNTTSQAETITGKSASADIPVRTQLEITPMFIGSLIVSKSDPGKVTIKLPGNIGKFSIRVYAVDGANHFGGNETFLITERPLNLQALLPRIARTGDKFECGVTVAGGDVNFDRDVTVTVQSLDQGLLLGAIQQRVVRVQGTTPVQVRFEMSSIELGKSRLRFTASSSAVGARGELVQDALEDYISVLGLQDPVYVATSMAITADSTTPWAEDIAFPPAVPGSGHLSLSAGVGRYPAVLSLASMLLTPTKEDLLDSQLLISRVLVDALIRAYNPTTNNIVSSIDALIPQAQQLLSRYTNVDLGLRWSDRYPIRSTDIVDASLNAYALYADCRAGKVIPAALTSQWRNALSKGIVTQVQSAIDQGWVWGDYSWVARTFLALGPRWVPDASAGVKEILSFDNLIAHVKDLDVGDKATVALIHLTHGAIPKGDKIVDDVIQDIISHTRVQGRTAYIASSGKPSAASTVVQSNCLSVLALKRSTHPFVEKIANYLAQGNSMNTGCLFSSSSQSSALAALALSDYDAARETTQPKVTLKVLSAHIPILDAVFNSPTDPVAETANSWTDLPSAKTPGVNGEVTMGPAPLSFVAAGTGEVSVALGMSFVPTQLSPDPIYRGIYVEKMIRITDPSTGEAIGSPIQAASFGQIVQVTVQITTPDDLWQVSLVDLVPGGLEPIDTNLANGQTKGDVTVPLNSWIWYDPFGSPQTLTDRVIWFANYLRAGTYSVTYRAVAVTLGTWQLPPAKATVAAQPEVMGLSSAGVMLVNETPLTLEAIMNFPSLKPFTPKECSSACTNSQFCNLRTGLCEDAVMQLTSTNVQACAA